MFWPNAEDEAFASAAHAQFEFARRPSAAHALRASETLEGLHLVGKVMLIRSDRMDDVSSCAQKLMAQPRDAHHG